MPEGKGWVSHPLPHGGTLSQSGKLKSLEEEDYISSSIDVGQCVIQGSYSGL